MADEKDAGGSGLHPFPEAVLPAHARHDSRPPRAHPRIAVRVQALVAEEDEGGRSGKARDLEAVVANVAERGLFIRTREPFSEGTRVHVVVGPEREHPVSVTGKVAWTRTGKDGSPGMGIALDDDTVLAQLLTMVG